jgi:WD40 repeat protein
VFGVAYSPRGDLAASAGSDGRVLVWDTSTWQRVAELGGPSRDAQDVNFSPDGERIVVAGADGVARVYPSEWFAPLGRLLALVPSRVTRDFTSAERVDLLHEPPPAGTQ